MAGLIAVVVVVVVGCRGARVARSGVFARLGDLVGGAVPGSLEGAESPVSLLLGGCRMGKLLLGRRCVEQRE